MAFKLEVVVEPKNATQCGDDCKGMAFDGTETVVCALFGHRWLNWERLPAGDTAIKCGEHMRLAACIEAEKRAKEQP